MKLKHCCGCWRHFAREGSPVLECIKSNVILILPSNGMNNDPQVPVPAKAGIQVASRFKDAHLGPRLRGGRTLQIIVSHYLVTGSITS